VVLVLGFVQGCSGASASASCSVGDG